MKPNPTNSHLQLSMTNAKANAKGNWPIATIQRNSNTPAPMSPQPRKAPVAPPIYSPNPMPKVLQRKVANASAIAPVRQPTIRNVRPVHNANPVKTMIQTNNPRIHLPIHPPIHLRIHTPNRPQPGSPFRQTAPTPVNPTNAAPFRNTP